MKEKILTVFLVFGISTILWSNAVVIRQATFSELVFDEVNNWTIEIMVPFELWTAGVDSIVLKGSNRQAKLKTLNYDGWQNPVKIITADSLSLPLTINRTGDSLTLYTYSNSIVLQDEMIFGNVSGATVGAPVSGYSIMRINEDDIYRNELTIDFLTKNPSLGMANVIQEHYGTLTGTIFDMNNNPVTQLKEFTVSPSYFLLHTPLLIDSSGTYTTQIFRRFETENFERVTVKLVDFTGWIDFVPIEPFELNNIHPDTTIVQDIHLKNNEYVVTSVKNQAPLETFEIELINYPNPFNASTNFFVKIPAQLQNKSGNIDIFNISGQFVKKISLKQNLVVKWDGTDENGQFMASGVYYYQLRLNKQFKKSGAMILLK